MVLKRGDLPFVLRRYGEFAARARAPLGSSLTHRPAYGARNLFAVEQKSANDSR